MYLQLDADCNDSLAYAWGSLYMYTVLYIYPFGPWNMDLVVRSSSPNMVVKQTKVKRHKVWSVAEPGGGQQGPRPPWHAKNIWNPAIASLLQSTYTAHTDQYSAL